MATLAVAGRPGRRRTRPAPDPLGRGRGRRHRVPPRRRAAVRVPAPGPRREAGPREEGQRAVGPAGRRWRGPAPRRARGRRLRDRGRACTHALVFGANVQRGSRDFAGDTERSKARKDAGVEALLFDDYPIRHWDHYLGPRLRRLYAATVPEGEERIGEPRDLDEAVTGFTFDESDADISPDGSFVVAVRRVFQGFPETFDDLVRYDVGDRRVPAAHPRRRRVRPPDDLARRPMGRGGTVHVRDADQAERMTLVLLDASTGEQRQLAADDRPAARVDRLGPGRLGRSTSRRTTRATSAPTASTCRTAASPGSRPRAR